MAALALVVERAAQSVRFKIEMKAADVTGRLDKVMSILVGLAAAPGELFEGEDFSFVNDRPEFQSGVYPSN